MVNARVHTVGKSDQIMNSTFRDTYEKFLKTTIQKPVLSQADKLFFVYYL